jgi:hypothetical protein
MGRTVDDEVNVLFAVRSKTARQAGYARLARQYGERFAENVRDQVETHHHLVETERAIARGDHGVRRGTA